MLEGGLTGQNGVVKFSAAIRRLGLVAESLTEALAFDVHIITDAYMFGELLDGPESVEVVSVAFVVEFPVLQPALNRLRLP